MCAFSRARLAFAFSDTHIDKTGMHPLAHKHPNSHPSHTPFAIQPNSELAFQIGEQFDALGATIGAKCAVLWAGWI